MRYRIDFLDGTGLEPRFIEADSFAIQHGAHIFYGRRQVRMLGVNDQWGNPRNVETNVAIASFSNVQSVTESPLEAPRYVGTEFPPISNNPFRLRDPEVGGATPVPAPDEWDNTDPN